MTIWAIADLHLSFGIAGKEMDIFGKQWCQHHEKICTHWDALVQPEDLVLIAGDISWAMHLEDAMPDLQWIHERPGTKVMIKGNHDYWWHTISKVRKALPKSIYVIHNDAFSWNSNGTQVSIGGARLWDSAEYTFGSCIDINPSTNQEQPLRTPEERVESERIFERELMRLELSVAAMKKEAPLKIMMTHYPPIGLDLHDSKASKIFERAGIQQVVFGHLHSVNPDLKLFGKKAGIQYHLTACDYLNFIPLKIE